MLVFPGLTPWATDVSPPPGACWSNPFPTACTGSPASAVEFGCSENSSTCSSTSPFSFPGDGQTTGHEFSFCAHGYDPTPSPGAGCGCFPAPRACALGYDLTPPSGAGCLNACIPRAYALGFHEKAGRCQAERRSFIFFFRRDISVLGAAGGRMTEPAFPSY